MYQIIGGDGKEYGPISAEQLKQWLQDRRVNNQTRVRAEGETEWRTLGAFPELAGPAAPPPLFEAPPNYMLFAVLTTLCGCCLFGAVAIYYSIRVNDKVAKGDYEAARQASAAARLWCWVAFIVGAILWIVQMAFIGQIKNLFQQTGGL